MCLGGCGEGVSRGSLFRRMTRSEWGGMGQSKILQGLAKLLTCVLILGEMRKQLEDALEPVMKLL